MLLLFVPLLLFNFIDFFAQASAWLAPASAGLPLRPRRMGNFRELAERLEEAAEKDGCSVRTRRSSEPRLHKECMPNVPRPRGADVDGGRPKVARRIIERICADMDASCLNALLFCLCQKTCWKNFLDSMSMAQGSLRHFGLRHFGLCGLSSGHRS